MKSLYDFIIKPLGERYNNKKQIGDAELILNNKIETWKFINKFATVVEVPLNIKTPIKVGDIVAVHHNIFRRFYDIRGNAKNSRSCFKDNLYFASLDQVYLYKRKDKWMSFEDRCFVKPIKNENSLTKDKEVYCTGILKIGNDRLEALKINPGDKVGFKPLREWEFYIDEERLYCMKSNDIIIKYEHKGNEEEYNPSWACSS